MRGFEWVPGFETNDIALPKRQTPGSAGYDLAAYDQVTLKRGAVFLVPTGVRVGLEQGEFLAVFARSSLALKHHVLLANGVGVIDADYYGNKDNLGHIMIPLINIGERDVVIGRGERIAQGVFLPFHTLPSEVFGQDSRAGGFGSTDH